MPLDAFVLRGLESRGLRPAPAAERHTLLRRLTYDLIGLPPSRAMIESVMGDPTDDWLETIVDHLLAQEGFGEKWAQHWLDLVRFAESKGHEQDFEIPWAWRYRDYVIRAFNSNVPYDDFVREHIAGDLLEPPRLDPQTRTNQSTQGTGFWHLGEATHSPVDIRGEEANRIDNQIDVFGKTFLGMTIACARCHDHKFDTITAEDYYALCGFLQSSSFCLADVADPPAIEAAREALCEIDRAYAKSLFDAYAAWTRKRLAEFPRYLSEAAKFARQSEQVADFHDNQPSDPANAAFETKTPVVTESLTLLADELRAACGDPAHPLYAFARMSLCSDGSARPSLATLLTLLERRTFSLDDHELQVQTTIKDGELKSVRTLQPFEPEKHVVVDFSRSPIQRDDWITSGACFDDQPRQIGQLLLRDDERTPLRQVLTRAGACGHAVSSKLTGFYRTRTFAVLADTLWYRCCGQAEVFLDVDSHRTVAGPLHGGVQMKIDASGDRWIPHHVADYLGHRVHVEFKPLGEFELYEVRFGSGEPPADDIVNSIVLDQLRACQFKEIPDIARALGKSFVAGLDEIAAAQPNADAARLVNWLLSHDAALPAVDQQHQKSFLDLAQDYIEARRRAEATIPEPVWALSLLDGSGEDEYVHQGGNHRQLAEEPTQRRLLTALGGAFPIPQGSGRLGLAERLVSPTNPLLARVFVNRVWHHLFGRGLVATVDNFGVLGAEPTHPELLDYLAQDFIDSEWDIKGLIRRLVLSQSYRMSTQADLAATGTDPDNKLLHAARVRRLTAEQIRDAILAVSGDLDRQSFGPSVQVHVTDFMKHNRSRPGGPMDGDRRRSIYIEVRRNGPSHFLTAFDKPTPFTSVGRRYVTNSAAQPLILLNDPLIHRQARRWARQLVDRFTTDEEALVDAYWQAFARPPRDEEVARIFDFLHAAPAAGTDGEARIDLWSEICLALYNVKEFIFLF